MIVLIGGLSYFSNTKKIKSEISSHLSGRAQNMYINGNIDESIVKFNRVIEEYPNSDGFIQSLIYLISNSIAENNLEKVNDLIAKYNNNSDDPTIDAALYNIKGDIALDKGEFTTSIYNYNKSKNVDKHQFYKYQIILCFQPNDLCQILILAY